MPYPVPTSEAASRIGRANRRTDTKPEQRLRSLLHRRGLRFRKDLLVRSGGVRTHVDIVFTRQRLAVFVDGCFWHSCPEHGTSPKSNTSLLGAEARSERRPGPSCGRGAPAKRRLGRAPDLGARGRPEAADRVEARAPPHHQLSVVTPIARFGLGARSHPSRPGGRPPARLVRGGRRAASPPSQRFRLPLHPEGELVSFRTLWRTRVRFRQRSASSTCSPASVASTTRSPASAVSASSRSSSTRSADAVYRRRSRRWSRRPSSRTSARSRGSTPDPDADELDDEAIRRLRPRARRALRGVPVPAVLQVGLPEGRARPHPRDPVLRRHVDRHRAAAAVRDPRERPQPRRAPTHGHVGDDRRVAARRRLRRVRRARRHVTAPA